MRPALLFVLACPAAFAAPLRAGDPPFSLRLEGLVGQPTTRYGLRGGAGVGIGWRLGDQLAVTADVGERAAPGGGLASSALGLQATLDSTPIAPYFELSLAVLAPRRTAGFSVASRTSVGADWLFARGLAFGVVVRQLVAADPVIPGDLPGGTEVAVRLVLTPGGK